MQHTFAQMICYTIRESSAIPFGHMLREMTILSLNQIFSVLSLPSILLILNNNVNYSMNGRGNIIGYHT